VARTVGLGTGVGAIRGLVHRRAAAVARARRMSLGHLVREAIGECWVDCASFAVMEEIGLTQFFGFDADFARAGFTAYR
jgi:hypothetical protein